MTPRPLFVHIGCSKTGTSSLQAGLWQSEDSLAAVGVGLPFVGRRAHLAGLVKPLGWRPVEAFVGPHDEAALDRLAERLRLTPGERLLLSNEELAEAGPEAVAAVAAAAERAGLDLHVVVTVRDWSLQLPSDYQQFLKHRLALSYPDFLAAVRDHDGEWAGHFWRRQDTVGILDRWGTAVPADRVRVIVVPPVTDDPDGVFRLLADAVGFPHEALVRPARVVNASYGVVESELFRRVNAALAGQLPDYVSDYQPAVRWPFARRVLARRASARLTLPPEHLGWVQEHGRGTVATLAERGYRVHGELAQLVPGDHQAVPLPPVDEAEIAAAAVRALADYAVLAQEWRRSRAPETAPTPRRRRWRRG